jgi:hypothetical protein
VLNPPTAARILSVVYATEVCDDLL